MTGEPFEKIGLPEEGNSGAAKVDSPFAMPMRSIAVGAAY
jgi:hypothetical protein